MTDGNNNDNMQKNAGDAGGRTGQHAYWETKIPVREVCGGWVGGWVASTSGGTDG